MVRRKFARLEFHRRLEVRDKRGAKTIQTKWQGTVARLAYQSILCNGVVSQSVVRGKLAWLEFHRRREVRDNRVAKLIQTKWRSACARMAYQSILLDVVVSQSVVRRKLARLEFYRRREVPVATMIQTKWRSIYMLSFLMSCISC